MRTAYSRGFSIVEVIVAAAIFTVTVGAFVTGFGTLNDLAERAKERTQAAVLLEEGAEAVLLLRDLGFAAHLAPLSLGEAYSLYWDGSGYQLSPGDIPIDGAYLRRVTFSAAQRNAAGVLVESGIVDPDTRRVMIEIVSVQNGASLASAEMLVHNAYE